MNLLSSGTIRRIRLGRAAERYAAHGWDVTPGARFTGTRFSCDRPGCPTMTCHPALDRWADAASHDPFLVRAWWRHAPHTILLVTGRAFDVLEVPAYLSCVDVRGPVAVTPTGRWLFLVRPGEPLRPELDSRLDVVRHGRDSWVPAPPSRLLEGWTRWAVPPEETDWRLPDPYAVQQALVDVVGQLAATPLPRHSTVECQSAA